MSGDQQSGPPSEPESTPPSGPERRSFERFPVNLSVDYSNGENFLFSYIENISEMGIFILSDEPLQVGTRLDLRFGTDEPLALEGQVVWVNPVKPAGDNVNPGMGIRFEGLTPEKRERIVELVRTIAYLLSNAEN